MRKTKPTAHVDLVLRGYLDAMLFTNTDESDESGGEPLDKNYSRSDVAPEAVRKSRRDIIKFLRANKKAVSAYGANREHNAHEGTIWDYLGHDLWLTRNGHGAGFWDRNYGGEDWIGEDLTEGAKKLGEVWSTVGDDGKIYID